MPAAWRPQRTGGYQPISSACKTLSSKPAGCRCCCQSMGQTEGRTHAGPLGYIDPALHTMRAASTQQSETAVFTYRVQFAVILFDDIRGEYDENVFIDTDICACLLCEKSDVILKSGST